MYLKLKWYTGQLTVRIEEDCVIYNFDWEQSQSYMWLRVIKMIRHYDSKFDLYDTEYMAQ